MKKTKGFYIVAPLLSITLFSACASHKEALKVLPNQLASANECKNSNKEFELDCYDLISKRNSFAQLRLGIKAQKESNYQDALRRYNNAKEMGNFYANALLADLYNKGLGVQKDEKMVLDLLENSSDVDPMAAYKLAYYYLQKDKKDKAIKLIKYAANNNVKQAQYDLYKFYSNGNITAMDLEKSSFWYEQYENKANSFINKYYGI